MMPNFAGVEKFFAHMTFQASGAAGHSCRKQFSTRQILNAKLPEPGGGSMVEQSDYQGHSGQFLIFACRHPRHRVCFEYDAAHEWRIGKGRIRRFDERVAALSHITSPFPARIRRHGQKLRQAIKSRIPLTGSLWKSAACKFRRSKSARFGRKTGVPRELFCVFARVFPFFRDFFRRIQLPFNDIRRSDPSKKNHT